MMDKICETCKFRGVNPSLPPCGTCTQIWCGEACTDNWQPAKPRRKELQAQLDALLGLREKELTTANAEIESMHKELAAKKAIIEEQNRELEEALAECTFLNEWSDIWEIMYNAEETWFTKMLKERDEALATCTELAEENAAPEVTPDMLGVGTKVNLLGEIVKIDDDKVVFPYTVVLRSGVIVYPCREDIGDI